jgi:hypothetical protein
VPLGKTTVAPEIDSVTTVAASVASDVHGGIPSPLEASSVDREGPGRCHVQGDKSVSVVEHDVDGDREGEGTTGVHMSVVGRGIGIGVLNIVMHEVATGTGVRGAIFDSPLFLYIVSIGSTLKIEGNIPRNSHQGLTMRCTYYRPRCLCRHNARRFSRRRWLGKLGPNAEYLCIYRSIHPSGRRDLPIVRRRTEKTVHSQNRGWNRIERLWKRWKYVYRQNSISRSMKRLLLGHSNIGPCDQDNKKEAKHTHGAVKATVKSESGSVLQSIPLGSSSRDIAAP